MPAVPSNKLQLRLQQHHLESQRADPWARKKIRGLILACYDRDTREQGVPQEIASNLVKAPGTVMIKCLLLSGKVVYVPLNISADERHILYGNNANMIGRPVEIEYPSNNIRAGYAKICADTLNLGVKDTQVLNALDISGAIL